MALLFHNNFVYLMISSIFGGYLLPSCGVLKGLLGSRSYQTLSVISSESKLLKNPEHFPALRVEASELQP
jgi:hypothetical protein